MGFCNKLASAPAPTSLGIKLKAGFYKAEIQQMQAERPQREAMGPDQQGGETAALKKAVCILAGSEPAEVPTHCAVSPEKDWTGTFGMRELLVSTHSQFLQSSPALQSHESGLLHL